MPKTDQFCHKSTLKCLINNINISIRVNIKNMNINILH